MEPRDFCYWLQGMLELGNPKDLNAEQVLCIKDHLALVFEKVTPNRNVQPEFSNLLDKKQQQW